MRYDLPIRACPYAPAGGDVGPARWGVETRLQAVSAQVFEEAAVDLGRALAAYRDAKTGMRKGRRVGFPKPKRKGRCRDSFRLRNKRSKGGTLAIRIGEGHARSVILPRIGAVRVHDGTRRLRRLLRPVEHLDPDTGQPRVAPRAKVMFATVSRHGSRWYVSLNVHAPDFHPERRYRPGPAEDGARFVGVDRGLAAFAVAAAADGTEVGRYHSPKPLQLIQTHDRLCLEDLAVADLLTNRHLARAIADAAWAEFARQLCYKAAWFGVEVVVSNRWFPSSKTCSQCGRVNQQLSLAERIFRCDACGLIADRDRDAAANLAAWAEAADTAGAQAPDRQAGGRATNALGGEGAGYHHGDGESVPVEEGTDVHAVVA
jgi:putative transposase